MTETINVANIDKVHKNPIAELVQTACQFESHIDISSEGKNINAKSLMGIMAFGLKEGIEVKVIAAGSDENEATDAIKNFLTCND
jgi:phosphocarrier protein